MLRSAFIAAMVLVLVVTLAPAALAAKPTTTEIIAARPRASGHVIGAEVRRPNGALVTKGVAVIKVFTRRDGKWRLVEKHRERATDGGTFGSYFRGIPSRGKCRAVVIYKGTRRWERSRDVLRSDCRARDWTR